MDDTDCPPGRIWTVQHTTHHIPPTLTHHPLITAPVDSLGLPCTRNANYASSFLLILPVLCLSPLLPVWLCLVLPLGYLGIEGSNIAPRRLCNLTK